MAATMNQFLESLNRMRTGAPSNPMMLGQYTNKSFLIDDYKKVLEYQQNTLKTHPYQIHNSVSNVIKAKGTANIHLIPKNRVQITDLLRNVDKVMEGKYLLCRTLAPPIKMSAISTIIEDPLGREAARLSLYNFSVSGHYDTQSLCQEIPVGQILAIKNPWFKSTADGGYAIRSDNPSDILFIPEVVFKESFSNIKWNGEIPQEWKHLVKKPPQTGTEWKHEGNLNFVNKRFELAIQCYSDALKLNDGGEGDGLLKDLLSNRAAAYISLRCFHTALEDLEKLLEMEPSHMKGIYRKARALCGLQRFQEAKQMLEPYLHEKMLATLMESVVSQHQQQTTGEYDELKLFHTAYNKCHEDVADFTGPVTVQLIVGKGRGLVATRDIRAGELIIVSKGFAVIFPETDTIELNINLENNSINNAEQQMLVRTVAKRLKMESRLTRQVYPLFAGPDSPTFNETEDDDTKLELDIKRISGICKYNSFGGNFMNSKSIYSGLDSGFFGKNKSSGLWILPSYINHSCWDSNCVWHTYGDIMFVRAFKEIKSGEEILISYISPSDSLKNREKIMKQYGFRCDCSLCQLDRDSSQEGARRTKLLQQILQKTPKEVDERHWGGAVKLNNLIKELRNVKPKNFQLNPSLVDSLQQLALYYFAPTRQDFEKSIDLLLQLYKITQKSILGKLSVDTDFNLIACYLKQGDVKNGKKWVKQLKQDLILYYGTLEIAKVIGEKTLELMEHFDIFLFA